MARRERLYHAISEQDDAALQHEALALALLAPDHEAAHAIRSLCAFRVN